MLFLPLLRFTPGAPRKANPPKLERSNQIRLFTYKSLMAHSEMIQT